MVPGGLGAYSLTPELEGGRTSSADLWGFGDEMWEVGVGNFFYNQSTFGIQ